VAAELDSGIPAGLKKIQYLLEANPTWNRMHSSDLKAAHQSFERGPAEEAFLAAESEEGAQQGATIAGAACAMAMKRPLLRATETLGSRGALVAISDDVMIVGEAEAADAALAGLHGDMPGEGGLPSVGCSFNAAKGVTVVPYTCHDYTGSSQDYADVPVGATTEASRSNQARRETDRAGAGPVRRIRPRARVRQTSDRQRGVQEALAGEGDDQDLQRHHKHYYALVFVRPHPPREPHVLIRGPTRLPRHKHPAPSSAPPR